MRLLSSILSATLAGTLLPAAALAQTCTGNAGFTDTSLRLTAALDLGEGYTSIGGGVLSGKPDALFFGGGLALVSPEFGDGGIALSGLIGKEIERPLGEKLRWCPFAGLTHTTNGGFGGSVTDFAIGGTVGYPLQSSGSGTTRFILTGGYTGVYERYELAAGFGSAEEWFGIIDAGVGIILSENLSITPGVRLYFRYSGGRDPSIMVRGSYGLGK